MKTNREEAEEFYSIEDYEADGVDTLTALLDRKEAETIERCARVCNGVLSSAFCARRIRALLPGAKP